MKVDLNLTSHAIMRCQQRGFKENDIVLVAEYGTRTAGGILLTGKDILRAEQENKRILDRLQKLKDTFLATTDNDLVKTVFRATKKQRCKQTHSW
ncbi:MAG: hypothetical protein OXD44_10920 [Gammaproteobacteria bacterium]|nr:hypothetical protein [Gammaproteobacteria bacterium]